ncbi:unnamed protein product [Danaus chrysippus]|uniref:(African queen) hypothetical protein n=1 Tax=Danaus chrysippus TaxID=151541 RepID=A0A8J2QID2_9NEOP|nr:unnamed protein product [Danaus chrysippus]
MNKETDLSSDISLDSLEIGQKKNSSAKVKKSRENVDTILVPFYEKDILIKVPKGNKNQPINIRKSKENNDKSKNSQMRSYLMNKYSKKDKKTSYLEAFRKQFSSNFSTVQNKNEDEIRSISPEFGDTERESIENGIDNNCEGEFYNTESYNEIYYEKLMNRELKQYFDDFMGDELQLNVDIERKSTEDTNIDNLKSVSEVSQAQHHARRTTVPPIQNVHLGGLGPDMENIKPRLERARSLQRYSEKVRMENRLRIYKKSVETDKEKRAERLTSSKQREAPERISREPKENKTSYLVNRTEQEKSSATKKIYKSKSADVQKKRKEKSFMEKKSNKNDVNIIKEEDKRNTEPSCMESPKASSRIKSSARTRTKPEEKPNNSEVAPVHISFLVNVGGVRPSSALRALEAQHRVYQEKVKALLETNNE